MNSTIVSVVRYNRTRAKRRTMQFYTASKADFEIVFADESSLDV